MCETYSKRVRVSFFFWCASTHLVAFLLCMLPSIALADQPQRTQLLSSLRESISKNDVVHSAKYAATIEGHAATKYIMYDTRTGAYALGSGTGGYVGRDREGILWTRAEGAASPPVRAQPTTSRGRYAGCGAFLPSSYIRFILETNVLIDNVVVGNSASTFFQVFLREHNDFILEGESLNDAALSAVFELDLNNRVTSIHWVNEKGEWLDSYTYDSTPSALNEVPTSVSLGTLEYKLTASEVQPSDLASQNMVVSAYNGTFDELFSRELAEFDKRRASQALGSTSTSTSAATNVDSPSVFAQWHVILLIVCISAGIITILYKRFSH
jgi:hypothetical protein